MQQVRWTLAFLAVPLLASALEAGEWTNQELADSLVRNYRTSGQLTDYRIDVETFDGVVTLKGEVANEAQKTSAVRMTWSHPGVESVRDELVVRGAVRPVQYDASQVADYPVEANGQEMPLEPEPIRQFTGGIVPYSDTPIVPPYSWPAYTPYNNYASMAYQTQYPAGAWPFIGPPHPYPMIPSGWRHVSLKWKKGYWWLKFHGH